MSYLLDTNVISELVRPKPDKTVLAWFSKVPDDALYLEKQRSLLVTIKAMGSSERVLF